MTQLVEVGLEAAQPIATHGRFCAIGVVKAHAELGMSRWLHQNEAVDLLVEADAVDGGVEGQRAVVDTGKGIACPVKSRDLYRN